MIATALSAMAYRVDWETQPNPTDFHQNRDEMSDKTFRVGVDIGGTFTDVVLIEEDGTVHTAKSVSTTDAYERGILKAVEELLSEGKLRFPDCAEIVHGTTVATNAIVERKGALTGLITTQGFRDVLELRRIRIPKQYELTWQKPVPLVERFLRREVIERVDHHGEVITPLDRDSVRRALGELTRHGIATVAVCLINSYANPEHEKAVREIIVAENPGFTFRFHRSCCPKCASTNERARPLSMLTSCPS